MKMKRGALILAMSLAMSCGTYSLIEPKPTTIGSDYTVEPQIRWSSSKTGKIETWTVDGPWLQAIRFVKGLKDGETLFKNSKGDKQPRFHAGMVPNEIMEFFVDSIASSGTQNVKTFNLRPQKFGEVTGFRFDLTFLSRNGLEIQSSVVGAIIKEKLHLLIYSGTRLHYYAKHRTDFERLIESIRLR